MIALQARTRLFRSHETIYAKLHDTIVGLVNAAGIRRLGGAEAVEFRKRRERERRTLSSEQKAPSAKLESGDVNEEKKPLLPTGAADAQEETAPSEGQVEPHATEPLPPAPRILEPVKTSLTSLRAELASGSPSASTSSTGGHMTTNPSNLVQPQGMLMRSLVTLNEYLESESYAAATFHTYRPYGAYGASAGSSSTATGERKALQEVTHNFKAEIRSIKGALPPSLSSWCSGFPGPATDLALPPRRRSPEPQEFCATGNRFVLRLSPSDFLASRCRLSHVMLYLVIRTLSICLAV